MTSAFRNCPLVGKAAAMPYTSETRLPAIAVSVFTTLATAMSLAQNSSADPICGYHIGNSLTWSAVSPGFQSAFQHLGSDLDLGYHIRCGSPLGNIVADPSIRCVPAPAPFGDWLTAMTQYEWDYLTLQTHAGMADEEIQAAFDVIDTATQGGRNSKT
jgi:hypothetical protein